MNGSSVRVTSKVSIGRGLPLCVIAGPCVIETPVICRQIAEHMAAVCRRLGLGYIFKASFDKANRTSIDSFRGPGLDLGIETLLEIREAFGVPVLTDVHETWQVERLGTAIDVLQIPAFLCRQTDLLLAAAHSGRVVNIKKGQFLAPEDLLPAVDKVRSAGNERILVTERGTTFGYHNLVVDMRGLTIMAGFGVPVVFDATHSVQLPGGQGTASGGQREFIEPLSRAAAAVGIDAIFLEVHPEPATAKSDGANSLALAEVEPLLTKAKQIHDLLA